MKGDSTEALAEEVQRLTDELEAARIERDKYKAANETMASALEQMDTLLRGVRTTEEPHGPR